MRLRSALAVLTALFLGTAVPVIGKPPRADQILRKAEAVRNPDLDYAVDFTIHGVAHGETPSERDASYSMIASGKDRSVILMRSPDSLYGALVLMADGRYWMLLPKASRPWELSSVQMRNGDVATGDLARSNLTRGYKAALQGDELVDGEPCWRLELTADDAAAYYARVHYWVSKNGFLPRKLEHYGSTGSLLKSVRYLDYRDGALGLRSMKLEIDSVDEWKESSTLTFSNLRKLDEAHVSLTSEGLIPLRDAALLARGREAATNVALEQILRALGPAR